MGNIDGRCDKKAVMKYAGAFIAWVIGSGFATGQEILQFFTSYGYYSYGVVVLNLVGFLFLGHMLMTTGYAHKKDSGFNHFTYYCGKRAGTFYSWLVLGTLLLLIAVLVSGAGAALSEYYGLNRYIGSLITSALVLGAYLVGFERLIRIVSAIGPVIIVFTLFVGVVTVIRDFGNITQAGEYGTALAGLRPSPSWMVSSVLYLSLNFLSGSTYFTALGMTAQKQEGRKMGGNLGRGHPGPVNCNHEHGHPAPWRDSGVPVRTYPVSCKGNFLCAGGRVLHRTGPGHFFLLFHHDVDGLQPDSPAAGNRKTRHGCGGNRIYLYPGHASIR